MLPALSSDREAIFAIGLFSAFFKDFDIFNGPFYSTQTLMGNFPS